MAAARRCKGKNKRGARCGMKPLRGTAYCWAHSSTPTVQAKRNVARSKGGQARKQPKATAPADVSTLAGLQKHLGQVLADTLLLPNTPKRSAAAARLLSVGAQLIEASETKLTLEKLMAELMP